MMEIYLEFRATPLLNVNVTEVCPTDLSLVREESVAVDIPPEPTAFPASKIS